MEILLRKSRSALWLAVFAVVGAALMPSFADASAIATPPNNLGLVGYWSFDDGTGTTATDFSGNRSHGTLTTFASPPTSASGWTAKGMRGGALQFDGSSDYVIATPVSAPTGNFTYSAWIYPETIASDRTFIEAENGDWEWQIGSDSAFYLWAGGVEEFNSAALAKANQWQHVVIRRIGSTINMWINGVADANTGGDTDVYTFTCGQMLIGVDSDSGCTGTLAQYFDGKIDEVRVYNRALATSSIVALYESGYASAEHRLVGTREALKT